MNRMKRLFAILTVLLFLLASQAFGEGSDAPSIMVRAGGSYAIALDANGGIWAWGDNGSGQLGCGKQKTSVIYQPIRTCPEIDGTQVADIQCGNIFTLFLMKDGTVWGCGRNNFNQLSPDKKEYYFNPVQVEGLEHIVKLACGYGQILALNDEGRVYSWGRNSNGQAGNGTQKTVKTPTLLDLEDVVDIQCGGKFDMVLLGNGEIWGWGDNEYGQLVDASKYKNVLSPVKLSISGMYQTIACGGDIGLGVDENGKLWAWGRNDYWQLGNDSVKGKKTQTPTEVLLPAGTHVVKVEAYNSHTGAITDTGALWQWGGVRHGQVGIGHGKWRDLPSEPCPASGVLGASVGSLQSYLLTDDGQVYGCGCNEYGQTGAYKGFRYYVYKWMDTGLNLLTGEWTDPWQ